MRHWFLCLTLLWVGFASVMTLPVAEAASARELDARVEDALQVFFSDVKGSQALYNKAKGALILPKVFKAGIGLGGEYGEGALRVGGKTVDYYNLIAGSYGFQLGAQKKSVILLFMDQSALDKFRTSSGWKVGADASVAFIKVGLEGSIDSKTVNEPILAFVYGQKGLMYDFSLEGAKFNKLKK